MPQKVLNEEEFNVVRDKLLELACHTNGGDEELCHLLQKLNSITLLFDETRCFVVKAKSLVQETNFSFTIDADAEVFQIDSEYSWVNGWILVKGNSNDSY